MWYAFLRGDSVKRIFAVAFAIIITLSFAGCGQEAVTSSPMDEGQLEDCYVSIENCKVSKDLDGKDIVIFYFKYQNTSNETTSFSLSTFITAFQDGAELDVAYYSDDDIQNSFKDVRPNTELHVAAAFNLTNLESMVEVDVKNPMTLNSDNDTVLTKSFELKDLVC